MTGWVWSTPADASLTSQDESVAAQRHGVCQQEHAHEDKAVEEQKQEADNLALLEYLQTKQEETAARMAQLSVWNDMHLGPRRIEYALEKVKKKAASFLKEKAQQAQSVLSKHSTQENGRDNPLPGISVVDLACFGGAADFYESPSHHDDAYKLFMGIDRDTGDGPRSSSGGNERSRNRALLEDVFSKFNSHADLEETIHSNLIHFQNGLLFEGLANNYVPMLKDDHIVMETIKKGAMLCRDIISRVHSKFLLETGSGCASKAPPDFSPRLEIDAGMSGCWRDVGEAVGKVRLVLLTEELARRLYVPASSSVANHYGMSQEQHTGRIWWALY